MRLHRYPGSRVIVTAIAFLTASLASIFSSEKAAAAQAAALPIAKTAGPAEVDGRSFDLVVIGGTPGGVACAVRAAREGLSVLLVNHTQHLGGFMTSGAGGWEAPYDGLRSPLYAETLNGTADYYRTTYGEESQQYRASRPNPNTNRHIDRPKVEPRIVEMIFDRMAAQEKTLTVLKGYIVQSAERDGALLKSVTLREMHGEKVVRVSAAMFADGMYEGDLAAAAKVPTRVGREARSEYNEPHAGVVYTRPMEKAKGQEGFPSDAAEGKLKIRTNAHAAEEVILPDSTGEADQAVMAYNYRIILTKDAANRVPVPAPADPSGPPPKTLARSIVPDLPNGKIAWNGGGRLIGPQNDYPEADWPTRERISKQYLDAALKQLWLIQNDPLAPAAEKAFWQEYGLAKDEFPDNGNLPYEIYVREARRIVGRYVFKEQDGVPAPGLGRTPIHSDSVAITDWPIDSVACLPNSKGGGGNGIYFLGESSRPAQVPYRSLLPQGVDNLLVPVALSASHVGWGCIRLEPVWMQTGEAAGFAAALAKKHQTTPAQLAPDLLLRTLVENHVMVSFFNDVDVTSKEPWVPAVEYFGTKGFFNDYNARPAEPLKSATAKVWMDGFAKLRAGKLDENELALEVAKAEQGESPAATAAEFAAMLPKSVDAKMEGGNLTRGAVLRYLYQQLGFAIGAAEATQSIRYIRPGGAGDRSGSDQGNGARLEDLDEMIRRVGPGGMVCLLADTGNYSATDPIAISHGGAEGKPVTITGIDTIGRHARATITGSRTHPYPATASGFATMNHGSEVFRLLAGADHLSFSHLTFENVGNGALYVRAQIADLTLEDMTARNVRRFLERSSDADCTITGLTVRRVSVDGFSKSAIRLDYQTSRVLIEDVRGDSMRQDFDNFAEGVDLSGRVHDVVFRRCVMSNSQQTLRPDGFWNGDGFATEKGTHHIFFEDCVANGCTDGGFDLKSNDVTLLRCRSVDNKLNFKLWGARNVVMRDCLSEAPLSRGGVQGACHVTAPGGASILVENCRFIDQDPRVIVFHTDIDGKVKPAIGAMISVKASKVDSRGKLSFVDLNSKVMIDGLARPFDEK